MKGVSKGLSVLTTLYCVLIIGCGGGGGGDGVGPANQPNDVISQDAAAIPFPESALGFFNCLGEHTLSHTNSPIDSFSREVSFQELQIPDAGADLSEDINGIKTRLLNSQKGVALQGISTANGEVLYSIFQVPFRGFAQGSILRERVSLWGQCESNIKEIEGQMTNTKSCVGRWIIEKQEQSEFRFISKNQKTDTKIVQARPDYNLTFRNTNSMFLLTVENTESETEVASAVIDRFSDYSQLDFKLSTEIHLNIECNKVGAWL